ncbi:phosphatidylglycerophosphate synthase [Mycetocola sp. BIGb0189]|uniref:hypothetical protein n=1 Tax=Mycetocola sp. BIGb0189 TaxID=2940604 RepID=UPI0021692ED1|nr:hypothetical protein [Mycetocola sp. BIGb0189]MCS4275136.1 phosphatidylglycerophosphate synthase [Mycetocola sp. BIGb0189]
MSGGGGQKPFGASFLSLTASLFFGVVLLILTVELAKQIWWLFALLAVAAAIVTGLRWVYRQKRRWNDR